MLLAINVNTKNKQNAHTNTNSKESHKDWEIYNQQANNMIVIKKGAPLAKIKFGRILMCLLLDADM